MIEWCGESHTGLRRKKNEDHFIAVADTASSAVEALGSLFAVADGMGGHPAGEVASRLACEALEEGFYGPGPLGRLSSLVPGGVRRALISRLVSAFETANQRVCIHGGQSPECRGMGTTLSALLLRPPLGVVAHVGDSRVYRLRAGVLEQLTRDDTFIRELVEAGDLNKEQARKSPMRHILEQSIGEGFQEVFTASFQVASGDLFLLCTDGLHDMVSDMAIQAILIEDLSQHERCRRLVEAALQAGGRDNVTVVAVEWKE